MDEEELESKAAEDSDLDPDERLHDINCFAFKMPLMNIHKSLQVDILHQLLKGVMMHVLAWTQAFMIDQARNKEGTRMAEAVARADALKKRSANKDAKVKKALVTSIIDRRFASMLPFATIRVLQQLSKVSQWTGAEQKYILRQMLPVFVPLLEEMDTPEATEAIKFIRATVDFVTLAMYESHDDDTLRYFELALHRMNKSKEVFRNYRKTKAKDNEGHFNFPKWHSLTHYVQMIRLYGYAPNWDTSHPEHKHHTYVKEGFRRTNKKNDWEDQLMEHHLRGLNMLALQDLIYQEKRATVADGREKDEQPVSVGEAQPIGLVFRLLGPHRRTKEDLLRPVKDIVELLGPEEGPLFRQAMGVFVRESRPRAGAQPNGLSPDRVERDDTWVNDYPVKLHHSVRCRKEHGGVVDDESTTDRNIARCARNWQRRGQPRHDWLWVQEFKLPENGNARDIPLEGRCRYVYA